MEKELPKNWVEVNLKTVLDYQKGKKPKKLSEIEFDGSVPYLDIKAFEKDEIRRYADIESSNLIYPNQLGIVWDGARSGWVTKGKYGAVGSTIAILKPKIINEDFTFHFLKSKFNYINSNTRGTGIPHVDPQILWNIKFPLPPLAEQTRITAKLDALFAQLDTIKASMEKIPVLLKNFRQQVLTQAVTGKLTEAWRSGKNMDKADNLLDQIRDYRNKEYQENFKKSSKRKPRKPVLNINANSSVSYGIPISWKQCFIGDVGEVTNGSTPSRKIKSYWNGKIPWVSSGLVQNNRITSTKESITEQGFKNSSVRFLPTGTVLIAMIGEGKTRGQSAILDIPATTNQNIAGIIIDHKFVLPEYLQYWFIFNYETNRTKGGGTGPKALNGQKVRELDFVLPPLLEQQEIVTRVETLFSKADVIEKQYQTLKEKIEQLPQALLHKAFKGELVPQLESDGDARDLLKEIEALKAAIGKNGKKQKTSATASL